MSIPISRRPCPVCAGKGFLFSNRYHYKAVCHHCRGTREIAAQKDLAAKIYREQHRIDVLSVKKLLSECLSADGAEP